MKITEIVGKRVLVMKDPLVPLHKGLEGYIDTVENRNGKWLFGIVATSTGPKIRNLDNTGERNVYAWLPGNHRRLERNAFEPFGENT